MSLTAFRFGARKCAWREPKVQFSGLGRRTSSNSSTSKESTISSHPPKSEASASRTEKGAHTDAQARGAAINVPSVLWYQRLGPVTRAFGWYDRTQERRPYMTQLFSSLIIWFIGDQLAQGVGGEPYDGKRTLRHLTTGAIVSLPVYKWFMFLGNHFNYSSKVLSIATKIVVQQIIFAPLFNTYFFGMQALLSGDDTNDVMRRIRGAVPESVVSSLKFWPAVTAFSFTFIQPGYRFLFSNGFAALWQTYLSYLNRREQVREDVAVGHVDV